MHYWECSVCGQLVKSETRPSSRLIFSRNRSTGKCSSEHVKIEPTTDHEYSTICFGGERGEDYYHHNWVKVDGKKLENRESIPTWRN